MDSLEKHEELQRAGTQEAQKGYPAAVTAAEKQTPTWRVQPQFLRGRCGFGLCGYRVRQDGPHSFFGQRWRSTAEVSRAAEALIGGYE